MNKTIANYMFFIALSVVLVYLSVQINRLQTSIETLKTISSESMLSRSHNYTPRVDIVDFLETGLNQEYWSYQMFDIFNEYRVRWDSGIECNEWIPGINFQCRVGKTKFLLDEKPLLRQVSKTGIDACEFGITLYGSHAGPNGFVLNLLSVNQESDLDLVLKIFDRMESFDVSRTGSWFVEGTYYNGLKLTPKSKDEVVHVLHAYSGGSGGNGLELYFEHGQSAFEMLLEIADIPEEDPFNDYTELFQQIDSLKEAKSK